MTEQSVSDRLITGDTYPRREALRAAGCRWLPERKAWEAPTDAILTRAREIMAAAAPALSATTARKPYRPRKCVACGRVPTGRYGDHLYRSGECRDCFEERRMGY